MGGARIESGVRDDSGLDYSGSSWMQNIFLYTNNLYVHAIG